MASNVEQETVQLSQPSPHSPGEQFPHSQRLEGGDVCQAEKFEKLPSDATTEEGLEAPVVSQKSADTDVDPGKRTADNLSQNTVDDEHSVKKSKSTEEGVNLDAEDQDVQDQENEFQE